MNSNLNSNGTSRTTKTTTMSTMITNGASSEKQNATYERKTLPYLFEKELIQKQSNCRVTVLEEFIPARKTHIVEAKFHARHELKLPPYEAFLDSIGPAQHKRRGRDGYFPRLESQVYGWCPANLRGEYVRQLNFVCAPKQRCDMTAFGEKLCGERITERSAFNGLRFWLQ